MPASFWAGAFKISADAPRMGKIFAEHIPNPCRQKAHHDADYGLRDHCPNTLYIDHSFHDKKAVGWQILFTPLTFLAVACAGKFFARVCSKSQLMPRVWAKIFAEHIPNPCRQKAHHDADYGLRDHCPNTLYIDHSFHDKKAVGWQILFTPLTFLAAACAGKFLGGCVQNRS